MFLPFTCLSTWGHGILSHKSTSVFFFFLRYRSERQCSLSSFRIRHSKNSHQFTWQTWAYALRGKQDKSKHWESAVLNIIFVMFFGEPYHVEHQTRPGIWKEIQQWTTGKEWKNPWEKQKEHSPLDKAFLLLKGTLFLSPGGTDTVTASFLRTKFIFP